MSDFDSERPISRELGRLCAITALLFAVCACSLRRMAINQVSGGYLSYGIFEVAQGTAIVAILLGLLGFSAATQIHPVFDGCTFVQAQMSLWLAGLLSMITFSIFHSQNYLESSLFKNGFLGESFGLWVVSWLLFWLATFLVRRGGDPLHRTVVRTLSPRGRREDDPDYDSEDEEEDRGRGGSRSRGRPPPGGDLPTLRGSQRRGTRETGIDRPEREAEAWGDSNA